MPLWTCVVIVLCLGLHLAHGQGRFVVSYNEEAQLILGLGFEIQSDSIGSGNHGLPESNASVPNDLVPSEKERFFKDMLTGFRYCRLAMGLYFRGLTSDEKHIVERWEGQAAGLAQMAKESAIEGFAPEYWSPAPGWKSTHNYIDGTLAGFNTSFLEEFGAALVEDVKYLNANNIPVVWWGLQNEPPVGPSGCIYSCCGYSNSEYYETFKVVAPLIRSAFPHVRVHANSWGGQHSASLIAEDPEVLKNVDVWTFHRVGASSDEQIINQSYFLTGAMGKPVANNEFEYLSGPTSSERCINTAQSIMNWFAFENSPFWYWLHALKPTTNSEASGYGLGYWRPWNDTNFNSSHFPNLPFGHFAYNPDNWNAISGFTRYLPWDSVRINVTEDVVRLGNRVLAYKFNPQLARWLQPQQDIIAAWSMMKSYPEEKKRALATYVGVVVSNRQSTSFTSTIFLQGIPTGSLKLSGFQYGPNDNNTPLGTVLPSVVGGEASFGVTLPPLTIQFWVQVD